MPELSSRGPAPQRTFLFLQGLATPFFADLARILIERGNRVRRINVCYGDELFWPFPATRYRGSLADWRKFLLDYLAAEQVTDVILFGDCRPYHRIAISLSAHRQVQIHVFEEGYFRPHWVTVERGGVNGYSGLPRDPATIMKLAEGLPERPEKSYKGSFIRRAVWDVAYNVANMVGRPAYPRYRRHRPHHVLVEYAGWVSRLLGARKREREARAEVRRLLYKPGGFFLVPLQLDSDYQIRVHSRFADLEEFLEEVIGSFALHAPPEADLLVKAHPLDSGLTDRRAQVARVAARHGVSDRVTAIDGGHLPTMLSVARGVVVVNSTVGTTAVEVLRPTITLGTAIYDIPGLTFQGGLDRFWTEAASPDRPLVLAFRALVMDRTQINGSFFSREGAADAAAGAADRVLAVEPLRLFYPVDEPETESGDAEILYPQPAG